MRNLTENLLTTVYNSKKKKHKKKKKRRKHQKDDSSDPSSSNDSDFSDYSNYRRKQRKNKKHQEKGSDQTMRNFNGKISDQKSLNISSLQTDYLNPDSNSGFGRNSERANAVHTKCTFCGGVNHSTEKCF